MTRRMHALLALSGLGATLFMSQAWAIANQYDGNWFLTAGAGRSFYLMDGNNNISACEGLPPDHYYKSSIHDGSFVSLAGGYSWTRFDTMFPAFMIGVNYTYAFNGKISGFIDKYSLSDFKNYSYSYEFSRQSVMGIIKVDLFSGHGFMPYVTAGGGVSFNRASSYEELPLAGVNTPRVSPGFDTSTHTSGAYMIGAGVDYAMRDDIWVTLGYQYGDYGTVKTGHGEVQASVNKDYSNDHLENKLRANSVSLEFTYLINYV